MGADSVAEGKLLPGDLVTAVNGQALGGGATLQSLLAQQFVQAGDDVVLECRRSLEVDHAHEQQLRFGRAAPRRAGGGDDVSQLMGSHAFHSRKPPPDKAMLAAKARVRREPRINGNLLEPDAYSHTLRYGSWSDAQRVGLAQGSGSK